MIKQSIRNYPSLRLVLKKNTQEKVPFYRNKQLNCIGCSVVCKIIFCSKLPNIPDKAGRRTRKRRTQAIAKCYAFHANAITKKVMNAATLKFTVLGCNVTYTKEDFANVKYSQLFGGWNFQNLRDYLHRLQRAKFPFLPQNKLWLVLKYKKRKCIIENISIQNGRSSFFARQNLAVHTGILVSKSC